MVKKNDAWKKIDVLSDVDKLRKFFLEDKSKPGQYPAEFAGIFGSLIEELSKYGDKYDGQIAMKLLNTMIKVTEKLLRSLPELKDILVNVIKDPFEIVVGVSSEVVNRIGTKDDKKVMQKVTNDPKLQNQLIKQFNNIPAATVNGPSVEPAKVGVAR